MTDLISVEIGCICSPHTSDRLLLNIRDDCPVHGTHVCGRRLYDSDDGTFAGTCGLKKRHRWEHEIVKTHLVPASRIQRDPIEQEER